MSGIEEVSTRQTGHKHQSESKGEGVASSFKGCIQSTEVADDPKYDSRCQETEGILSSLLVRRSRVKGGFCYEVWT
jgi:hypothetical protein